MTDAVQIFDAAWQMPINSLTGLPYSDGVVSFYLASTTTPLEVFSDADLTVTLGVSVACDASGYPTTSGNAKTLIYVGTSPYKIDITSAIYGGTLFEADNVRGAVDTSLFVTSAVPARKSIVPTSANRVLTVADLGKLINANPTAGTLTMTLDPAATLGDGWWAGISHDGSANAVRVIGNGVDAIARNGVSVTSFALTGRGQTEYIVCNGTGFRVDGQIPPLIGGNTGIILIADRLSTPPGSPLPGARYIVTAAPAGAWSTFAEHDIAEANGGGGWFKYTPSADCGWLAYVQDEDRFVSFTGATWKETAAAKSALTEATGLQDADLISIERAGVLMKARRPTAFNNRFIISGSVSAAATLDITTLPADCDVLEIDLWNWRPATDNASLYMRFSQSATFLAGAADYKWGGTNAAAANSDLSDSKIIIQDGWGNAAGEYGHAKIRIFRPNAAATPKSSIWEIAFHNTLGNYVSTTAGGELIANLNAIDGVRFLYSSGNITEGFYAVRATRYA